MRSGPNTLLPYAENPGRTFVLGEDPVKHRLRHDVEARRRAVLKFGAVQGTRAKINRAQLRRFSLWSTPFCLSRSLSRIWARYT
ncbi:MAG TPA: hypothetical protein VK513_02150, partial [Terriglobales bacterium]|nr:hypothetical protein [Terriglobales bacterium]